MTQLCKPNPNPLDHAGGESKPLRRHVRDFGIAVGLTLLLLGGCAWLIVHPAWLEPVGTVVIGIFGVLCIGALLWVGTA